MEIYHHHIVDGDLYYRSDVNTREKESERKRERRLFDCRPRDGTPPTFFDFDLSDFALPFSSPLVEVLYVLILIILNRWRYLY